MEGERWACSKCGRRSETEGACAGCGFAPLLDLDRSSVRDLLREEDLRRLDRAHARNHRVTVGLAVGFMIAMWCVPGYWELWAKLFGPSLFVDQIVVMVALGLLFSRLVRRDVPASRYPWLDSLPPASRY